jgi:Uma2 family endonuclease
MSEAARKRVKYSWTDYQSWSDDQRWEIIGGDAYAMSPSPSWRHQKIVTELAVQMHRFFKGKRCELVVSPMDVVLSEEDVVQPDLLVVCDKSQIKPTHVEGAPALVVEIVSESSSMRDRLLKLNLYARSGVREYWIVTPFPSMVEVLLLANGKYLVHNVVGKTDTLQSPSFPELKIALADVFDFPLEPGEEPPVAKEPPAPAYRVAAR